MKLFLGLATQDGKNAETGDQVAPGSPSCRPPLRQPTAATSSRHFSQKIPRQARDCRFLKALQKMQPNDPYIIQQLAPATYKSEMPDKIEALWKAKDILMPLAPSTSSDAETVGSGALCTSACGRRARKRRTWTKGWLLLQERPLQRHQSRLSLDVRASLTAGDEAVADHVRARRIRGEILDLCNQSLKGGTLQGEDAFWVLATKVEALVGLRDPDAEPELAAAVAKAPQPWMAETLVEQIGKLKALLR